MGECYRDAIDAYVRPQWPKRVYKICVRHRSLLDPQYWQKLSEDETLAILVLLE